MNDQEIRLKAVEYALAIVKPESNAITRDERGNIHLKRELYDTIINITRLLRGKFGDENILKGDPLIYPVDESE
jgi:hypothetical protein